MKIPQNGEGGGNFFGFTWDSVGLYGDLEGYHPNIRESNGKQHGKMKRNLGSVCGIPGPHVC